ncbi:MAG: hypothetical protein IPL83_13385 [Bdellovibrionales bacterium]|nr:hypothetical protein [Bdellovibrionales bacterium]
MKIKTPFVASLLIGVVCAHAESPRPELNLTSEQRSCLEGEIGKPGEGSRPSREQMEAAFNACEVQAPQVPPGGRLRGRQFTDQQKTCLEGKIGKPGDRGSRPSREKMEAAFKSCGVQPPKRPVFSRDQSLNFDSLSERFAAATNDDEKSAIRESMSILFQATSDETKRDQIREFLKQNPENWITPTTERQASSAVK